MNIMALLLWVCAHLGMAQGDCPSTLPAIVAAPAAVVKAESGLDSTLAIYKNNTIIYNKDIIYKDSLVYKFMLTHEFVHYIQSTLKGSDYFKNTSICERIKEEALAYRIQGIYMKKLGYDIYNYIIPYPALNYFLLAAECSMHGDNPAPEW